MITRAKFRNFKALRDVEITFESRLTVLVGPNGSGKTSVLQGLNYLTRLAREANDDPETQFQNVLDFQSNGNEHSFLMEVEGKRENAIRFGIRIELDEQLKLRLLLPDHQTQHERTLAVADVAGRRVRSMEYLSRPNEWSQEKFDLAAVVAFDAKQLASPTIPRVDKPLLSKEGSGLAATLVHLRNKSEDVFKLIESTLCRVIHNVKKIRFDQAEVPGSQGILGHTLLLDFKGADSVPARHISSGTLYALGLLTVLFSQDSPSIVLVDDLDQGLHPMAQSDLINTLRIVLSHRPELQIIATSHSPYILDKLQWNEVRVTSLNDDGSAICKQLVEHPDFKKWKEAMTPGEFWSHAGEEWVKNPRLAEAAAS